MPFDIAKAIEKLGEAVDSGFSYAERCKECQSETEIIKDRKKLQKAIDAAEHLVLLTYKYFSTFDKNDKEKFEDLAEKFFKYN